MANSLLHLQWHSVLAVVLSGADRNLVWLCGVGTSAAHVSGGASRPINLIGAIGWPVFCARLFLNEQLTHWQWIRNFTGAVRSVTQYILAALV